MALGGKQWTLLKVAILLVFATGCITDSVVWLPDSSGFIYTDRAGSRLNQFDLKKGARRVIVEDTSTKTSCPAISSDGKRIAVARIEAIQVSGSAVSTHRTQIVIYDRNGAQIARSRWHETSSHIDPPAQDSSMTVEAAGLNWSGPADKILLEHAIYDCSKDEFVDIDVTPWPLYNIPVVPSKKGFLAMSEKGPVFVDWDGWVTEFKNAPAGDKQPQFISFAWDGDVAALSTIDGIHEFDAEQMTHRFKPGGPKFNQSTGKLLWVLPSPKGGCNFCIFTDSSSNNSWLEIQDVGLAGGKCCCPQVLSRATF